ncbi:MAG: ABC transporter permease [Betaproteobacteria bacterium]
MTSPKRKLRDRRFSQRVIEPLAAPGLAIAVLIGWQLAVPLLGLSEFVLPTPLQVITRMAKDYPLLLMHARVTLFEVLGGFAFAVLAGIPTALLIFYSRIFERAVYPLLIAEQAIPKVALAPLVVLYLGYGWAPKIFLAFLIGYFPIVVATVVGLQSLNPAMVSLVRSMGASATQTFFKIRLPAALPSIFGGLKLAIGLAVIGAVIGEYVAAERGLGYLQLQANSQFDTTLNFAAVITISALGVMLFFVLRLIENAVVFRQEVK